MLPCKQPVRIRTSPAKQQQTAYVKVAIFCRQMQWSKNPEY
jgi:hypothetical protein